MEDTSRRDFLKRAATGATIAALAQSVLAQTSSPSGTGVPTRVLGRTGQRVSILCLGGWHLGSIKDDAEAVRLVQAAVDEGLTFMDNCWDYHDGRSEELMGRGLEGRRDRAFVMTKNCERDYAGSMRCLEDSLRRLRTDRIDLWQFHEMVYDNDPDWVFDKGGIKAAVDARKAGKVRFIGFTGHKDPHIHLKMLGKPFEWDTAQMPINALDAHYRSFQNQVVPVCLEKKVGVIGMKGYGGNGIIAKSGLTAAEAYRYALSLPVSTQVVGLATLDHLKEAVALARSFTPMSAAEKSALLARVQDAAGDGRYELFKSTVTFDGVHHRKQHGFAV
jgi:uncharacterized protein